MTCTRDVRGYWNGCRCEACTEAEATYRRDRKRARARPDALPAPTTAAAGQVRAWLELLRSHGLGLRQIAARAGVGFGTAQRVLYGEVDRVRTRTGERLFAVMPSQVAPGAWVSTEAALVQLAELKGAGWSPEDLADAIYGPGTKQREVMLRTTARKRTVDRIAALHLRECPDELDMDDRDPLAAWRLIFTAGADEWKARGACRHLAGDVQTRQVPFFPERGGSAEAALEVCARCPVALPCLELALASTYHQGVWGRTTGQARRLIRHMGMTAAEVLALAESAPERPLVKLLDELASERAA